MVSRRDPRLTAAVVWKYGDEFEPVPSRPELGLHGDRASIREAKGAGVTSKLRRRPDLPSSHLRPGGFASPPCVSPEPRTVAPTIGPLGSQDNAFYGGGLNYGRRVSGEASGRVRYGQRSEQPWPLQFARRRASMCWPDSGRRRLRQTAVDAPNGVKSDTITVYDGMLDHTCSKTRLPD